MKEYDKGSISKEARDSHIGMQIQCGLFSYQETPKLYDKILGVTGTLRELGPIEKVRLASSPQQRIA